MSAEPIAEVIADIRAGRTRHPAATDEAGVILSLQLLERARRPQPVVDVTAIHAAYMAAGKPLDLYDDHPSITPPWPDALLCYVNSFGNVLVLQVHRKDHDGSVPDREDWFTDNDVDWSRVRWIAETSIWAGGRSAAGGVLPTSGPCHMFRHAIHEDGSPADINWLALMARRGQFVEHREIEDRNKATWDAAMAVLGGSLNFLNASNVDVAEPSRPRPERRRLARTGVQVQTVVVRPPGKHRSNSAEVRPIGADEALFSPVRGHWARYGIDGRGLLFGKYSGKFWISGHVRGAGEAEPKDYVLKPGRAA